MSEKLTYEQAIERLSQINQQLSSQIISLDEASKLFEEGEMLLKFCYDKLKVVKGKMLTIRNSLDGLKLEEEL